MFFFFKILFLRCIYCSFHVGGVLLTVVLMPFLCWCQYLLHVGASTFPMLVVLLIMHLCYCPFRISVVVLVTYMCYCSFHIMLMFFLHWPCCSSHVILLLLSLGVVILFTLVFSFFQHDDVVFFCIGA
jgi:hypothetical protein